MFSNRKQNIPELFQEIMKIDEKLSQKVISFKEGVSWRQRKAELRTAAQEFLHWNIFNGKAR